MTLSHTVEHKTSATPIIAQKNQLLAQIDAHIKAIHEATKAFLNKTDLAIHYENITKTSIIDRLDTHAFSEEFINAQLESLLSHCSKDKNLQEKITHTFGAYKLLLKQRELIKQFDINESKSSDLSFSQQIKTIRNRHVKNLILQGDRGTADSVTAAFKTEIEAAERDLFESVEDLKIDTSELKTQRKEYHLKKLTEQKARADQAINAAHENNRKLAEFNLFLTTQPTAVSASERKERISQEEKHAQTIQLEIEHIQNNWTLPTYDPLSDDKSTEFVKPKVDKVSSLLAKLAQLIKEIEVELREVTPDSFSKKYADLLTQAKLAFSIDIEKTWIEYNKKALKADKKFQSVSHAIQNAFNFSSNSLFKPLADSSSEVEKLKYYLLIEETESLLKNLRALHQSYSYSLSSPAAKADLKLNEKTDSASHEIKSHMQATCGAELEAAKNQHIAALRKSAADHEAQLNRLKLAARPRAQSIAAAPILESSPVTPPKKPSPPKRIGWKIGGFFTAAICYGAAAIACTLGLAALTLGGAIPVAIVCVVAGSLAAKYCFNKSNTERIHPAAKNSAANAPEPTRVVAAIDISQSTTRRHRLSRTGSEGNLFQKPNSYAKSAEPSKTPSIRP